MKPLLSVNNISIQFQKKKKYLTAVQHVSFQVEAGKILGIVGESGCGKSVTSLAVLGLLAQNARVSEGEILFDGRNLLTLSEKEMCKVRGNEISMIFQDPMTALNPTMMIGEQLLEPFILHQGATRKEAWEQAIEMLRKVGISSPEKRMKEYPHQMSGGMLQRVVIAIALACRPKLLIADEPTTALDVTIQAQILDLIRDLSQELGTAVIIITHDMGVVAETADDVLVMYAGETVEYNTVEEVFNHPKHPYTKALLKSIPNIDIQEDVLNVIPGMVPALDEMPEGCRFAPRCAESCEECSNCNLEFYEVGQGFVRCLNYKAGGKNE